MSETAAAAAAPAAPAAPAAQPAGDTMAAVESEKTRRVRTPAKEILARARAEAEASAPAAGAEGAGASDAAPEAAPAGDGAADAAAAEPETEAEWKVRMRKERIAFEQESRRRKREAAERLARAEAREREADQLAAQAREAADLLKSSPDQFFAKHGGSVRAQLERELAEQSKDPREAKTETLEVTVQQLQERLDRLTKERETESFRAAVSEKKAEIGHRVASLPADDYPYLSAYEPDEVTAEAFQLQAQYWQQNKSELAWDDIFGIIEEHLRNQDQRLAKARERLAKPKGSAGQNADLPRRANGADQSARPGETVTRRIESQTAPDEVRSMPRRQRAYEYVRGMRAQRQ